jgi:hypothetical protein
MRKYRIIHRGPRTQRGSGLGSIFASLFRGLVPLIKTGSKIAVKSGAQFVKSPVGKRIIKSAKKELVKSGTSLASDIAKGENVGKSLKKNLKQASGRVAKAAIQAPKKRVKAKKRAFNGVATTTTTTSISKRKKKGVGRKRSTGVTHW